MIYLEPDQWTSDDNIDTYALQMPTGQYIMDSADEPWSFYSPDNNVLRFEVQPGDYWADDPAGKERDEIAGTTQYAYGTPIDVSYSFMVEPGAANTAAWLVLGQLHQVDYDGEVSYSPPFSINLIGEQMAVHIGWTDSSGVDHNQYIYVSPTNIVRGQYYNMNIAANFDPAGNGQLVVTCNGQLLATYTGPLGIAGHTGVFWKEGIYEASSPETLAVDYKNLNITSGGSTLSASSTPALPTNASAISYAYAADDVISAETVTNLDRSQDVYNFNTTGAYYVSSHLHYDPTGALTQTVDYNPNGSRSFAQVANSDGSQLRTYYDVNGNLTKSIKNYASGIVSILNYANNALAQRFIENPDGSSTEFDYGPGGAVLKFVQINADGSKTCEVSGITGQDYVAQTTIYNTSGQISSISRANAAGFTVFVQQVTATATTTATYDSLGVLTGVVTNYTSGTVSTSTYVGGLLSERLIQYADGSSQDTDYDSGGAIDKQIQINVDGSKVIQQYDIIGQSYVAETDVYNAAGQLTSLTRTNAAGATVFSQGTDSTGTITVQQYTAAGVLTESSATTASGVVTTNWYAPAGNVTAQQVTQPGGAYVYDSYDPSGALTQEIDYAPGVSTIAYDYSPASSPGAASTTPPTYTKNVTAYESGLTIASDGINDTFNSFGGDTFVFTSGFGADVINNFHVAGANQDLIQLSSSVTPSFASLAIRQSGDDTLITIDADDSIRLTGVNPSTFSQANIKLSA